MENNKRIAIIGAGIGGLSVAHHLKLQGFTNVKVFEATNEVGGLARSFEWHGINCDLAPHRLFTRDAELLNEMLALTPCDRVIRNSRICLSGKWISDPINGIELLFSVRPGKALGLFFSYLQALLLRADSGESFHSFVQAKYGSGLNQIFFKPYAEKLFGIPATEISASWGESKVRVSGLKDMLKRNTKLYFDHFYYPTKGGYGAFVEALFENVKPQVLLGHCLQHLKYDQQNKTYTASFSSQINDSSGEALVHTCDYVVNTIPISNFMQALGKPSKLKYRSANLVYLLVDQRQVMKQQWVYFVNREYPINRMAEFKNFTVSENTKSTQTVLCAEVTDTNNFSVERVIDQLVDLKVLARERVIDSKVIKINNAYPVYDLSYAEYKSQAENVLNQLPNLFSVGRQAEFMHQDVDEIYASAKNIVAQILRNSSCNAATTADERNK